MSLKDFARVCNLPFIEQDYDQTDHEGNEFNFDTYAHTLLIDPSSRISYPFTVSLIRPDNRLIHHTMNHVLFPRKINFSTIQKLDVPTTWFLKNQVEKNWADFVLRHMLDSKRKNITLPCFELITKILTYTGYDFGRICSTTAKKSKVVKKKWHSFILIKHPQWYSWWANGNEFKD